VNEGVQEKKKERKGDKKSKGKKKKENQEQEEEKPFMSIRRRHPFKPQPHVQCLSLSFYTFIFDPTL
jgi:hypothetical protein